MPSTARIGLLIALVLLPGSLLAQTYSNAPSDNSALVAAEPPPAWVMERLPEPSPGTVRIAPPVAAEENIVQRTNFEEPREAADKKNNKAIPLSPHSRQSRVASSSSNTSKSQDALTKPTGLPSMATVLGSLGVVLGIFLLIAWLMRRAAPQGLTRLPSEAFEVLGRAPLFGRQNVHLIRCGNKLLLVSVTPAGTETLTEIIDPQEVDRLAGLCRQAGPQSSTAAFKQIFEQLAPKRPVRGAFSKDDYAEYDSSSGELSGPMDWEQRHV
jgi:flagellar biogenesis protein FliO